MQPVASKSSVIGRILAGIFVGAVIGLLVECVFLDGPPENRWILFIGPAIGASVLAITAAFFGHWELHGRIKTLSIYTLIGLAIGGFGGTAIFPAIMVAIEGFDPVFHEKIHAHYANVGFFFGVPIGIAAGIIVGLVIAFWKWRSVSPLNSK